MLTMGWKLGVFIFMGIKLEYFQQKSRLKQFFGELLFGIKVALRMRQFGVKKDPAEVTQ